MSAPAPRRIRPWIFFSGAFGLIVLGILLGGYVWLRSDGDLRRFDAETRARGLPASWADLGLTQAPAATLTALQRIDALGTTLAPWQNGSTAKIPFGDPPSPDLIDHHAGLPATELSELLTLLDQLGSATPIRRTNADFGTTLPELSSMRNIARLLAERLHLAKPEDCPSEARRLLRSVHQIAGPELLITHLVRLGCASIAAEGIARRLDVLARMDPTIADELRLLADRLEAGYTTCHRGEMLGLRTSIELDMGPGALGSASTWWHGLVFRAGRADVLADARDFVTELEAAPDMRARLVAARAREMAIHGSRSRFDPGSIMIGILAPARSMIATRTMSTTMHLRVVAAELDGKAWPEDLMAAPGTTLRRGERDGRLIFAYSVGKDGRDDGGAKDKDERFALYGPVDPPATLPAAPTAAPAE